MLGNSSSDPLSFSPTSRLDNVRKKKKAEEPTEAEPFDDLVSSLLLEAGMIKAPAETPPPPPPPPVSKPAKSSRKAVPVAPVVPAAPAEEGVVVKPRVYRPKSTEEVAVEIVRKPKGMSEANKTKVLRIYLELLPRTSREERLWDEQKKKIDEQAQRKGKVAEFGDYPNRKVVSTFREANAQLEQWANETPPRDIFVVPSEVEAGRRLMSVQYIVEYHNGDLIRGQYKMRYRDIGSANIPLEGWIRVAHKVEMRTHASTDSPAAIHHWMERTGQTATPEDTLKKLLKRIRRQQEFKDYSAGATSIEQKLAAAELFLEYESLLRKAGTEEKFLEAYLTKTGDIAERIKLAGILVAPLVWGGTVTTRLSMTISEGNNIQLGRADCHKDVAGGGHRIGGRQNVTDEECELFLWMKNQQAKIMAKEGEKEEKLAAKEVEKPKLSEKYQKKSKQLESALKEEERKREALFSSRAFVQPEYVSKEEEEAEEIIAEEAEEEGKEEAQAEAEELTEAELDRLIEEEEGLSEEQLREKIAAEQQEKEEAFEQAILEGEDIEGKEDELEEFRRKKEAKKREVEVVPSEEKEPFVKTKEDVILPQHTIDFIRLLKEMVDGKIAFPFIGKPLSPLYFYDSYVDQIIANYRDWERLADRIHPPIMANYYKDDSYIDEMGRPARGIIGYLDENGSPVGYSVRCGLLPVLYYNYIKGFWGHQIKPILIQEAELRRIKPIVPEGTEAVIKHYLGREEIYGEPSVIGLHGRPAERIELLEKWQEAGPLKEFSPEGKIVSRPKRKAPSFGRLLTFDERLKIAQKKISERASRRENAGREDNIGCFDYPGGDYSHAFSEISSRDGRSIYTEVNVLNKPWSKYNYVLLPSERKLKARLSQILPHMYPFEYNEACGTFIRYEDKVGGHEWFTNEGEARLFIEQYRKLYPFILLKVGDIHRNKETNEFEIDRFDLDWSQNAFHRFVRKDPELFALFQSLLAEAKEQKIRWKKEKEPIDVKMEEKLRGWIRPSEAYLKRVAKKETL